MSSEEDRRRLRWRCRRGMRELDQLLMGYVDRCHAVASVGEQRGFERLICLPDPDILALLTGQAHSDDKAVNQVVAIILAAQVR